LVHAYFICQGNLTRRQLKGPLRSLSQAAACYYQSNHSKVWGNSAKCLAQGRNKRTCCLVLTLSL